MKQNYYIMRNGCLKRKDNTIYFIDSNDKKRPIPVENIDSIFAFGELELNNKLLVFLSQNHIPLHIFNYYGFYSGTFHPREFLNSGFLLVKQVNHYTNSEKRIIIAKEFVKSASENILKNLKYYENREKPLSKEIERIEFELNTVDSAPGVEELMGVEGRIRKIYYQSFNKILSPEYEFKKRVRRPPDNMINCLISFGNSMIYSTVLSEIYRTQLNPTISYLHEPGERRFSLSLDISEVFKPVIVDRIIFKLLNKRILKEKDFSKKLNYCYLNESGKRNFLKEYDQKMKNTIKHKKLKRKVSYRRLIRLENYKLIKHLLGERKYEGFRMWW